MTEVAENVVTASSAVLSISEMSEEKSDPHPRLADYKARSIRSSQEERRFNLLLEQKERRKESFNESRGILEAITSADDIEDVQLENEMEWSKIEEAKHASGHFEQLMMSEWFIEVPSNLADLWYMVPCPKGKRCLVLTARGFTKAFNKYRCQMASFPSVLPGGNKQGSNNHGSTILDCIWHPSSKTYYILDVLSWNNQPLLDCETEFRFFWLKTKIQETEGIAEVSEVNPHPFILLPHYPCDSETLSTVLAMHPPFPDEAVALDGLLFYHSQCHYKPGTTPLVGWLKPFMVPEALNIAVAQEFLEMKPAGYENWLRYIEKYTEALQSRKWYKMKKKKRKSNSKEERMECTVTEEEPPAE